MLMQANNIQKEQLWGVVTIQAIVSVILLVLLLRACSTHSASALLSEQALITQAQTTVGHDTLIAQAENRIANDNVIGGIALLDVTIQQGQPSARVFGARGAAYARIGDYHNAAVDYQQAAVLAPENADYQFGLCFARVQVGQYQEALPACSSTLQINPNHVMAWNNRCYIRAYHVGDYEGAVNDCTQAVTLNKNHAYPYNNRARAYLMTGAYQEAITDATQSIELGNPYAHLPLTNRGTSYAALGDAQAALNDYQAAIQANSEYDEVYARLGELYRWQNQSELARQAYCQYLVVTNTPIEIIAERANELGGCT